MRRAWLAAIITLGVALGPPLVAPAILRAQIPPPPDPVPADTTPPAVEVVADPDPFSPNGDGRRDATGLVVTSSETASIEILVLDGEGTPVASFTLPSAPPGSRSVTWDGKGAPDGTYLVRASAEDPAGNRGEAETTVTVDTKRPRVRIRATPGIVGTQRRVPFHLHVRERGGPVDATLRVLDTTREVGGAGSVVKPGRSRLTWRPRYRSGKMLYPGTYRARVRALDLAGNRSRPAERTFRVEHATPPVVVNRVLGGGRRVALTFDDCHFEGAWSRILQVLRSRRVRATFFCPGGMVLAHPELARRTVRDGHAPGSHGFDHAALAGRGEAATFTRVRRDANAWWAVTRTTSAPYFRPPYGSYDGAVVRASGRASHPRVVMWDVDPLDWTRPGVGAIASRVVSRARPGSIILLHTIDQTAAALPAILSGLRSRGLTPVSLPELFRRRG